jgi:hypothetical protein
MILFRYLSIDSMKGIIADSFRTDTKSCVSTCCICMFIALVVLTGCSKKSEYQEMEARELAKGIRRDSLFLGLKFGMTAKEFFAHCWQLNKQGLVMEGASNTTVLYKTHELKQPASMNFYPQFKNDKINKMPVTFSYDAWAPWNKHLFADSLQLDVLALFKKWYGEGFIAVHYPEKGTVYVKVDGNRRISIFKEGDMHVKALFTDLLAKE